MTTLSQMVSRSRSRGVPILTIATLDPLGTEQQLVDNANNVETSIRWTCLSGLAGINEKGIKAVASILAQGQAPVPPGFPDPPLTDPTKADPPAMFELLWKGLPPKSCVYVHMGHKQLQDTRFLQGLQITRQIFKSSQRQMILIGPDFQLPPEVSSDAISLEDPLPTDEQISTLVAKLYDHVEIEMIDGELQQCVGFCRGLTEFQAEQNMYMSMTKAGMDFTELSNRRAATIGNIRGLELYSPRYTFDDLGGLTAIKDYFQMLFTGKTHFDLVVWLDEIEKSSLSHTGDSSGTNADQLGQVLSFMADEDVFGIALAGHPGGGKSFICKAIAGEFNVQVLRLDLGAVQDKYVGSSQQYLRTVLRTIKHLGHKPLFISTANELGMLDDALMSRFSDVFFFDLPDVRERTTSWEINCKKYEVDLPGAVHHKTRFSWDEGWTHRNIAKCCEKAAHFDVSVEEVATTWMVSEDVRNQQKIARRQADADGKYLSATYPGTYRRNRNVSTDRSINLDN